MNYGISNRNGQINENQISKILDFAWENGIDTLDTAKTYGSSEKSNGNYIKKNPDKSWKIITKINDEKNIVSQINDSIKKLTIRPTLMMAHSAELFLDNNFQKELCNAIDKKIVKKGGVSLYNENELNQVLNTDFKPDVIQLPMNILDTRLYRKGILTLLYKKGIEIHVRSAFLQGLFYINESKLKNHFSDVIPYIKKLKSIAAEAQLTLAEFSLLWLVSLNEVSKVIIGVDNVKQLKTHLMIINKKLNPSLFEQALSIHYENKNILNPSLWPSMS
tara:strand:+ start:614 stop:1441 length:828 start_codon:yes stop_codon:yes gene_type:complete